MQSRDEFIPIVDSLTAFPDQPTIVSYVKLLWFRSHFALELSILHSPELNPWKHLEEWIPSSLRAER